MMIHEFESLTGFYPTPDMYRIIEKEYVEGPWKDKQEFCRAYTNNIGGLAERLTREAYEEGRKDLIDQITKSEALLSCAKEWQQEAERLQKELDNALEWQPYMVEEEYSDEDYNGLYDCKNTKKLSTTEAKELISQEFGFKPEMIEVQDSKRTYEIDRYRRIRGNGRISRAPLYNASDWNYIRFKVCGYEYEYQDGELCQMKF